MIAKWLALYRQRSATEQRTLRWGAACLGVLLVWAAHDWASQQRQRLEPRLPALAAQLDVMRTRIPLIVRQQSNGSVETTAPEAQKPALLAAARSLGLALEVGIEGQGLTVRGVVDFDRWLEWLGQVQRDQRLRVIRLNLVREGNAVRVDTLLAGS